jgi:hypothetical protein
MSDLNSYLFDALDKLSDEGLTGEELDKEINRANAITKVAEKVIDIGEITLKALKFKDDAMNADLKLPRLFSGDE